MEKCTASCSTSTATSLPLQWTSGEWSVCQSIRPVEVSSWASGPGWGCGRLNKWCRQHCAVGRCSIYRCCFVHVSWFEPVQRHHLLSSIDFDSKRLVSALDNLVGSVIRLLQRLTNCIMSHEDMVTVGRSSLTCTFRWKWWWVGVACSCYIVSFNFST